MGMINHKMNEHKANQDNFLHNQSNIDKDENVIDLQKKRGTFGERETKKESERQRERERQREKKRQRVRVKERQRETKRESERQREKEAKIDKEYDTKSMT